MNYVATTEIVAYNEFRAQLAELRDLNDKTVFDYHSPKGTEKPEVIYTSFAEPRLPWILVGRLRKKPALSMAAR